MSIGWFNLMKMKKKLLIGFSLLVMGVFYLKVISPVFNIHIPCIFNKITGLDCPGCGMTRAALSLLDGNIYQAFRWNMLIFMIIPLYFIYTILVKIEKLTKWGKAFELSMLALAIIFFILRNTDKFSWLAPTNIS